MPDPPDGGVRGALRAGAGGAGDGARARQPPLPLPLRQPVARARLLPLAPLLAAARRPRRPLADRALPHVPRRQPLAAAAPQPLHGGRGRRGLRQGPPRARPPQGKALF